MTSNSYYYNVINLIITKFTYAHSVIDNDTSKARDDVKLAIKSRVSQYRDAPAAEGSSHIFVFEPNSSLQHLCIVVVVEVVVVKI